jgi:hypothetical protein
MFHDLWFVWFDITFKRNTKVRFYFHTAKFLGLEISGLALFLPSRLIILRKKLGFYSLTPFVAQGGYSSQESGFR